MDAFANVVNLPGDSDDHNADEWAVQSRLTQDPLDGYWSSRWNMSKDEEKGWKHGLAFIKRMNEFVFIMEIEGDRPTPFLICARQETRRLIGRYVNLIRPSDSTPWVGLLVDDDRIDGEWEYGRWDFRREKG